MAWIKNVMIRVFAKNIKSEIVNGVSQQTWDISRAKLTAVVYVLVIAIQELGPAFGHPIVIPESVYRFLQAMGLWTIRDAIKS